MGLEPVPPDGGPPGSGPVAVAGSEAGHPGSCSRKRNAAAGGADLDGQGQRPAGSENDNPVPESEAATPPPEALTSPGPSTRASTRKRPLHPRQRSAAWASSPGGFVAGPGWPASRSPGSPVAAGLASRIVNLTFRFLKPGSCQDEPTRPCRPRLPLPGAASMPEESEGVQLRAASRASVQGQRPGGGGSRESRATGRVGPNQGKNLAPARFLPRGIWRLLDFSSWNLAILKNGVLRFPGVDHPHRPDGPDSTFGGGFQGVQGHRPRRRRR